MQQAHSEPVSVRKGLLTSRRRFAVSGIVLLLLLAALWAEMGAREDLGEIWSTFLRQIAAANWVWAGSALLLMPLNWLAETQKWRRYMLRYEPMPLGRALLTVWIGVSFSMFTPNRIGEYGGRILLIRPRNRWKAVIANLLGNLGQLLVLLTAGMAGAYFFLTHFWTTDPVWRQRCTLGLITATGALYILYFNLKHLAALLPRAPWLRRQKGLLREMALLQHFNTVEVATLLGWAALRYGIYTTQYYLLLRFFGINPGLSAAYAGISLIFLLQTTLPLPPVAALVARGNLAVQIWSFFGANEISSLAATFTLWIINLILPALIGTFFLFYVNIAKSPGYEDD